MPPTLGRAARLSGLLFALTGIPGLAQAQAHSPRVMEFPIVGVGHQQTLQATVHALGPCAVMIAVYQNDGNPKEVLHFEFTEVLIQTVPLTGSGGAQPPAEFPGRLQLRATVTMMPSPGGPNPCAQVSEEIFENFTKSTAVIVPPVQQPPGPPNFGAVGLGFIQTVRLNVLAHPPQPCYGTLSFLDANQNPIGPAKTVSLAPGSFTYLDLPGETAVARFGERAEVVPVFTPPPGAAPGMCTGSVEVFDQLTGWSRVLIPPGPQQTPASGSTGAAQ